MLEQPIYDYLRAILQKGPIVHPVRVKHQFQANVEIVVGKCHLIAMQAALELGHIPIPGVAFIDVVGKLCPWPHIVNREPAMQLFDYSPQIDQTMFGFIEIPWNEFEYWRHVTDAFNFPESERPLIKWSDPLSQQLSDEFYPILAQSLV